MALAHKSYEIKGWLKGDPKHHLSRVISVSDLYAENYDLPIDQICEGQIEDFMADWPGLIGRTTVERWK